MENNNVYIHNYPSCLRTYATLCIYHHDLEPSKITTLFGVEPSRSQIRGTPLENRQGKHLATVGAWFLTSKDMVISRDVRFHIDYLLERFKGREDNFRFLHKNSYKIQMNCFWESTSGNGGPLLDYKTMSTLGKLFIDVHFDVWFDLQST